ncbi:MAG: ankyrin repeat domain-containing protein [Polyangiaceae bacterium]
MKHKAAHGQDSNQAALRALFEAIAAREPETAGRLLVATPSLATLPLELGASRADASSNYFKTIEHYAYAGDTALHLAAAAYATEIALRLLATGARVNAKNRRGAEALHYATDGIPGSPAWDPDAQRAMVELLIQAGANPNALDNSGVAPLHRAVRTRSASAVRALLSNGAQVRLKNKSGSTPLHLAVQTTGRGGSGSLIARAQQAQIIGLLLEHGARASDQDTKGKSVTACVTLDWVRELLNDADHS